MYKLLPKTLDNKEFVRRLLDGVCIPFDPDNTDYQAYLKWIEAGGVPEAADE